MASIQQPLIRLIDARVDRSDLEVIGTCVSVAYRWYDHALGDYMWVMDVDLGLEGGRPDANTVVKSIPIADASHGVHKAGPSTKLRLRRRSLTQTYEIVGLASIVNGQVAVIEVTYGAVVAVAATQTYGSEYRLLTYSDLGNPAVNGGYKYGTLPYGTIGKYNAQGVLQYPIVVP
jgi:hypothetical protein